VVGRQIVDWRHQLDQKWVNLRFGEAKVETEEGRHMFEIPVFFGDLVQGGVRVELYADGVDGGAPVRQEMKRVRQLPGKPVGYVYSAAVSAVRLPTDYSARIVPYHPSTSVPLEATHILWQR
jgi:starch phosphorylase